MPRQKRSIGGELCIEGQAVIWRVHREQQWCMVDGWKGLSIEVQSANSARRSLFLEYPTVKTQKQGWMRTYPGVQTRIRSGKIEAHIRLALAAGWDPDSRGKPFVYQVNELPGEIQAKDGFVQLGK